MVQRTKLENKAANLSKLYPTKDLNELFTKFPKGFMIETTTSLPWTDEDFGYNVEELKTIKTTYETQTLTLTGDPDTKTIKGSLERKKTTHYGYDEGVSEDHGRLVYRELTEAQKEEVDRIGTNQHTLTKDETLFTSEIAWQDGRWVIANPEISPKDLLYNETGFLFQKATINKQMLSHHTFDSVISSPYYSSDTIGCRTTDPVLEAFVPERVPGQVLRFTVDILKETQEGTAYAYTVGLCRQAKETGNTNNYVTYDEYFGEAVSDGEDE